MRIAFRTHSGMVTNHNEDFFSVLVDPHLSLVIVADGVGGHHAGEVASRLGVKVVQDFLANRLTRLEEEEITELLRQAFHEAHQEITRQADSDDKFAGMGTTMVLGLFQSGKLHLAHVGDSRAYLIESRGITSLTQDHSLVASMVQSGMITSEEAKTHHLRNIITQCLGCSEYTGPEIRTIDLTNGDIFLFCSDGLTDMLDDKKIYKIVRRNSRKLPNCADKLVAMANKNGGCDNITVVVVNYNGDKS
ncbi:MAG TPA: Stp1/IreP family PP2C-type Ser/Thr phosphatase [Desulfobacterales bacterium]|nr:Stp1/IreP family PP2C-type Ser/Thr phosphatase [Desulfobacterales bacterium]